MPLQLHSVAPRQGLVWVRRAFQTFFRRPMALTSLFLAFLFVALLAVALPWLGGILLVFWLPLLSLGYMLATRSALTGGPVHAGQLVAPLLAPPRGAPGRAEAQRRRRSLLLLCLLYAAVTVGIIWLSDWIDGGRFERLQLLLGGGVADADATRAELETLALAPELRNGLLVRFGLAALLSVPFWHAPALVWWGGQDVAQSLFSSTLACWRTKGAFTVYGLAWMGVIGLFGVVAGALFGLLGASQLMGVAVMPAGLIFTTVFYVSLYFSFTDTFGDPAAA